MSAITGTAGIVRLVLRRDRIRAPLWILGLAVMAGFSASATVPLYPTIESRVIAAETLNSQAALVALYGRIYDPTSLGSLSLIKLGGFGAVFVALFAIITVVRHTRAEEESGRAELLGSTVVGRYASLTATLVVVCSINVVLALVTAVALIGAGLPVDGSLAFGAAWGGVGIAFGAIAGVAAQMTRSARATTGIAVGVLGVVYVLRAIGDASASGVTGWLTWLSPIGWGQQFRPYAGNRWWVLLITLGFSAVTGACAFVLAGRRDLGAGLLADRPGPGTGAPSLRNSFALAWRLQRATVIAWAAAFILLGLVFGAMASSVGGFLNSPEMIEWFAKLGGEKGLTDMFLAVELGFIGIFASAFGIQTTNRLRSEETGGRAEPVLATATSRMGWAGSYVVVAIGGTTLLMVLAGVAAGLGHALASGRMSEVGRVLAGALVQLPAVWVLTGIVVTAFGLLPRAAAAAGWVALAVFLLLGEFGALFGLEQWLMDLSPFAHVPKLPGGEFQPVPLLLLTAVAAGLIGVGLAGFRRRDLA